MDLRYRSEKPQANRQAKYTVGDTTTDFAPPVPFVHQQTEKENTPFGSLPIPVSTFFLLEEEEGQERLQIERSAKQSTAELKPRDVKTHANTNSNTNSRIRRQDLC